MIDFPGFHNKSPTSAVLFFIADWERPTLNALSREKNFIAKKLKKYKFDPGIIGTSTWSNIV